MTQLTLELPSASKPQCQFSRPGLQMTTRYATEADAKDVLRLFVENLWPIAHFQPDMRTVGEAIFVAITQNRMIVVERNGEIAGCAAFDVLRYWYSAKHMVFDQGLFVVPTYRKTRAAALLLNALKDEALRRNTVLVMQAGTKDKSVAPILAKRYPAIGVAFVVDK